MSWIGQIIKLMLTSVKYHFTSQKYFRLRLNYTRALITMLKQMCINLEKTEDLKLIVLIFAPGVFWWSMGQGRGHDGSQHPGPGPHVCPPRQLPGQERKRRECQMYPNLWQPVVVKSNLIKFYIFNSIDLKRPDVTSIPLMMFLTAPVFCTNLEFLFILARSAPSQWLCTFCF